ncbi:hypothetical protein COO03_04640 [Bacillus sp. AFS098217]|uniref:hypothetical protein n=1 Tax=Bacillus sp. AFS098217 TaxID=2033868 RepID=UPI000BEC61A2|nr:hypothetical protein [Bacillus sp. AFS098217]PEB54643.1 hypothetical protein COO03_04640 [Bacillus sp. AFS098217]
MEQLQYFLKRICILVPMIISLKLVRQYLKRNEALINDIKTVVEQVGEAQLTHALEELFIMSLSLGIIGLIIGFLIYRFDFLGKKICSFIVLFLIVDSIFYYIFPEIPLAILKSALLATT